MNAKPFWAAFFKEHEKVFLMGVSLIFIVLTLKTCFFLMKFPKNSDQKDVSILPLEHPPMIKPSFEFPMFGVYTSPLDDNIKASTLDLHVVGIFYSNQPKDSQVFIESNGVTHLYGIEDSLPEGAVVKQIQKDGIVIFYLDRLEKVKLPKQALEFKKIRPPDLQGIQ